MWHRGGNGFCYNLRGGELRGGGEVTTAGQGRPSRLPLREEERRKTPSVSSRRGQGEEKSKHTQESIIL
jgi:hypothetical protein